MLNSYSSTNIIDNNYNQIFKYMIGDTFLDSQYGDKIEITGLNYTTRTYQGNILMKFGDKIKTVKTNMIFESKLDKMAILSHGTIPLTRKIDKAINYRIYYFEENSGNRSIQRDVQLSNIRALAKLLNSIVKTNPKRRIIMVSILDDN